MKHLILISFIFLGALAQADMKNPSSVLKAKIQKLAMDHIAVQALLKSSASVVMMDQKACSIKAENIQGEIQNNLIDGAITLIQNCSNAEMDGGSHTTIEATISADRVLIDKVEIGYSGF